MRTMNVSSKKIPYSTHGNKNQKEGAGIKKLNGHKYKEWLKSRAKRVTATGSSSAEKDKLPKGDGNVAAARGGKEVETTISRSSVPHSPNERVDFWLKRVNSPVRAERRNDEIQTDDGDRVGAPTSLDPEHDDDGRDVSESPTAVLGLPLEVEDELTPSIASPSKSTVTNFVEYWVPVKLSDIQIEQYCGFLFSNSGLLCSEFKPDFDSSDILHDMLISTRKSCDHPYLVDRSLRTSLIQGVPDPGKLDAEIKLSSKLHLLHKILLEIKQRGLRALILYQSLGGSGLISAGDILDDILHEKFGGDSFVRIHGGISRKKRKELLTDFNYKGSRSFACLMETRDCVPSVKLSSIDIVILFNSDWDPVNDLKALRRINLHSQLEQVKVFRLYSAHTVEEKALILAKLGMSLEANVINIKLNTCHGLLSWGAPYLLGKLDEFHKSNTQDTNSIISSGASFVDDVFHELSSLLPNNGEGNSCTNYSLVLEVQPVDNVYPKTISLLGEVESPLIDDFSLVEEMVDKEPPCVVWINLLRGRKPRWKYLSSESRRARRRVQHLEGCPPGETASKKCRNDVKSNCHYIPAVLNRRIINQLPMSGRKRKHLVHTGSGKHYRPHQKVKSLTAECVEKVASHICKQNSTKTLRRRKKSTLLPTGHGHVPNPKAKTIQNGHSHRTRCPSCRNQAAIQPPTQDSAGPIETSLQHSTRQVPLQTPHAPANMVQSGRERHSDPQLPDADPLRPLESTEQCPSGPVPQHTSGISSPAVHLQREPTTASCQPPEPRPKIHSGTLNSICSSLHIELETIGKEKNWILEEHENMKLQMRMACEKEIEQIQKKYDLLLQNSEIAFTKEKEVLETRYTRVCTNKMLAEVMMLRDDPKYKAASSRLMEDTCQRILLQNGLSSANQPMSTQACASPAATFQFTSPGVVRNLGVNSQSSPPIRHDQPSASPRNAVPQPASSMSTNHFLPDSQTPGSVIADPLIAVAGLTMNSAPPMQFPQRLLGFSTTQFCSMSSQTFNYLGNLQIGYDVRVRTPAPHLRHMRPPLPTAATKLLSSGSRPLSPVETQGDMYNLRTKNSPPSYAVGVPASCHGN